MSLFLALVKGIYLGLALVMPLGPLNVFILNNSSLQKQYIYIWPVILVAGVCDLSLILCAVSGVNVIAEIPWFKNVLMGIGIVFLFTMGIRMWRMPSRAVVETQPALPLSSQIFYSVTLSLFNPHSILDTFVVIGAVSATFIGHDKIAFTAGCMLSDFLWFAFLGTAGYFLHRLSFGNKIFAVVDKASSLIMIFLAVQLLIDLVLPFVR